MRAALLTVVLVASWPHAAGALPCRHKDQVQRLICLLQDDNPLARRSASYDLRQLGAKALPRLIEALRHEDARVRQAAARTLPRIRGAASPAVVAPISRLLEDKDVEVRRSAAGALGELGPGAASAVAALVKALQDPDKEVKNLASVSLASLGQAAAPATKALARMLDGKDAWLARQAAQALGHIGPHAAAAVPALIRALDPKRPGDTRRLAAWALSRMGGGADKAVPALKRMTRDKDSWNAEAARLALKQLHARKRGAGGAAADASRAGPAPASIPPGATVILTGPGDADFKRAAAALTKDLLRSMQGRKRPLIEIGEIANRSSHHLDAGFLQVLLYRELSRVRRVKLVGGPRARPELLLGGWFLGEHDAVSRQRELVGVLVGLSLVDLRSGRKVWLGIYPIRKLVERTGKAPPRVKLLGPQEDPGFSSTLSSLDAAAIGARIGQALLKSKHRPRRLQLAPFRNRTSEHLNWRLITLHLEQALVAAGRVRLFVDPYDLQLPGRRAPGTRQQPANTHLLGGEIRSAEQKTATGIRRTYTIKAELLEAASRREVWSEVVTVDKKLR